MGLAAPPPARLKARTEFSITLEMPSPLPPGATGFRFEYREASERSWDKARQIDTGSTTMADGVLLDDLNPTSTYEIRIYAINKSADGTVADISPPSDVAAVDTEVPGCTPEPSCSLQ
jgi:hypothetical protein